MPHVPTPCTVKKTPFLCCVQFCCPVRLVFLAMHRRRREPQKQPCMLLFLTPHTMSHVFPRHTNTGPSCRQDGWRRRRGWWRRGGGWEETAAAAAAAAGDCYIRRGRRQLPHVPFCHGLPNDQPPPAPSGHDVKWGGGNDRRRRRWRRRRRRRRLRGQQQHGLLRQPAGGVPRAQRRGGHQFLRRHAHTVGRTRSLGRRTRSSGATLSGTTAHFCQPQAV